MEPELSSSVTADSCLAVVMGKTCWTPKRWLGVSTKPPVPGVEASTKVSGDTHSALPVVSTTRLRETPFFASFAGSTSTCSCRSR